MEKIGRELMIEDTEQLECAERSLFNLMQAARDEVEVENWGLARMMIEKMIVRVELKRQ